MLDELEQGLYDPEAHSTEVRFVAADRKTLVPLARAVGRIAIRYPIEVRTTIVRAGSPDEQRLGISIDGPYVKYPEKSLGLPEVSAISGAEPIRAYDAAGKRLERYDGVSKWESADGVSRKTIAFWGPVASVRFDTVEKWSELEIPSTFRLLRCDPPAARASDRKLRSRSFGIWLRHRRAAGAPGGHRSRAQRGATCMSALEDSLEAAMRVE